MALDPGLLAQMANPPNQYANLLALKNLAGQQQLQQGERQLQQQQIQQGQMAIQGQQALDQVFQGAFSKDASGNITINRDAVVNGLTSRGAGHLVPGVLENFNKMDQSAATLKETQQKVRTAADDYTAYSLLAIKDADFDPAIAIGTIAHARETGAIPADQAVQMANAITSNPTKENVQTLISPLLERSQAYQKLAETRITSKAAADSAAARVKTADTSAAKETRESDQQKFQTAISELAATPPKSAAEYQTRVGALPYGVANRIFTAVPPAQYDPAKSVEALRNLGMTPEQQTQAAQAKTNAENTENDRKLTREQNAQRLAIEWQNAGINAKKFSLEFGGDAVKGWAKQIADNPDTVGAIPPALRTAVQQEFTRQTGLPLPKALSGTAVDQERASRNALDAVEQINAALADPEIQSRIGAILGRLGNAEQKAGSAVGLSPAAEAKAQRLRTNMRYLVFQEGKALLGGRPAQQLIKELEKSSPRASMDIPTLQGALAGVSDAANRTLDTTFQQRFGGNFTRPGGPSRPAAAAGGGGAPIPLKDGTVLTPHDQASADAFRRDHADLIK